MANKAAIEALIAAFTDNGANTSAEFRTFETTLLGEIYPTPLSDTTASTNVWTSAGNNCNYQLRFWKQGRTVHIEGVFITTGAILGGNVATITNTEYIADGTTTVVVQNSAGDAILMNISSNIVDFAGSIGSGKTMYINCSYPVAA